MASAGGTRGAAGHGGWMSPRAVFASLAGILLLFVLLPIALLLPEALTGELGAQLASAGLRGALAVSLGSATAATGLALLSGVPAGYLLARSESRLSWLARGAFLLPLALPPVAAGVLLLNVFGPRGPLGGLLTAAGAPLVNAFGGIVLAQLFVTVPFVVLTAEAAFRSVDPVLEEASETLGQGGGRTFFRVALPLARYGILAGAALAWMRALGEFGATVVLAYHPHSLPVYLWVELTGRGLRPALPVALVALTLGAVVLGLAEWAARAEARRRRRTVIPLRGPGTVTPPARQSASVPGGAELERPPAGTGHERGLAADVEYEAGGFRLEIELEAGAEIVSLFGPSGAGKSTLLRLLAGLTTPERGRIELGGVECFRGRGGRPERNLPASERPVGMVFQRPTLFPHLDVEHNILFGVADGRIDRPALRDELLALTRLEGLERRHPDELSGGQQQRVALARALARRPRVLLLDEPFSSLDFNMRERLHRDVRRIQRAYDLCVVFVTHELRDACVLADRLAVISDGRLLQVGRPLEVLRRPATRDVARFTAVRNLLPAVVETADDRFTRVRWGDVEIEAGASPFSAGEPVTVCVRPEDVVLLKPDRPLVSPADENVLAGRIVSERLRGATITLELELEEARSSVWPLLEIELPVRSYDALGIASRKEWRVSLRRSVLQLVRR